MSVYYLVVVDLHHKNSPLVEMITVIMGMVGKRTPAPG